MRRSASPFFSFTRSTTLSSSRIFQSSSRSYTSEAANGANATSQTQALPQVTAKQGGFGHFVKTTIFVGVAAGAAYGAYTFGYYDDEGKLRRNAFPFLSAEEVPTALNPNDFVPFKLKQKIVLNHDTRIFRFALGPNQKVVLIIINYATIDTHSLQLGLPVASCIVTRIPGAEPDKPLIRPYTPVTTEDTIGYFDLLIKVYPEGNMSKHIDSLKVGDSLDVRISSCY